MTELEVVHIQKVEWVSAEEGKRQCASQTSSRLTFGAGLFPFCPDTEVHQTPQPRHYTPEQNSNSPLEHPLLTSSLLDMSFFRAATCASLT